MSKVLVSEDSIVICSESCVLYQSIKSNGNKLIDLTQSKGSSTQSNGKETSQQNEKPVDKDVKINFVCCALSFDNLLLAVQSPEKKLLVFKIQNWDLIYERQLARGASKIIFSPDNKNIIVGDKTGDVFLFDIDSDKKETLLLGHLSIVLDIIMTDNSKYIITCDRDEKIRVSNYPNCYNIESYCLGHEQFVTNVQLLPHNKKLLISCSGDGTLRLWNYIDGTVKNIYDFKHEKINSNEQTAPENQLKCFTSVKLTSTSSLVCVSVFKSQQIHLLLIKDDVFQFISTVSVDYEPVHLQLSSYVCESDSETNETEDIILWLVGPNEINAQQWNSADMAFKPVTNTSILRTVDNLKNNFKELGVEDSNVESVIYVLQKRKMDEITDYFARKQARIEEKMQKNQSKQL